VIKVAPEIIRDAAAIKKQIHVVLFRLEKNSKITTKVAMRATRPVKPQCKRKVFQPLFLD